MIDTSASSQEPRWRRLPEERPRQIIEAAIQEFGDRGLAAARLEDIARRAGVSKGTIYLYFPNKEALFREMIRQLVGESIAEAHDRVMATEHSATGQIRAYTRAVWEYMRTPVFEKLHRLASGELRNFPVLYQFFLQEVPIRNMNAVAGLVRRGIAAGEFRELDADVAARMFLALMLNHGVWCAKRQQLPFMGEVSDEQLLEQMLDFFLHAIAAAPIAPTTEVHE
jgi:AcrR family transcriptional regulator